MPAKKKIKKFYSTTCLYFIYLNYIEFTAGQKMKKKSSRQTSPSSAETIKDGNQLIQPPNDQRNSVALSEKEFNVDVPYIDQGSIQDLT